MIPTPSNEQQRSYALKEYAALDMLPEQAYDDFTLLAAAILEVPVALITILEEGRLWFKSKIGVNADVTRPEFAFCSHTILTDQAMIVRDATKDIRFSSNPAVTGEPGIRFYAGVPLIARHGFCIGTLCMIDFKPRDITDAQKEALEAIARQIMARLELRRAAALLAEIVE